MTESDSLQTTDGRRQSARGSDVSDYDTYELNDYYKENNIEIIKFNQPQGSQYFDAISHTSSKNKFESGLYFLDGKRKIDYVLVYKYPILFDDNEIKREHKRIVFEKNLMKEGLYLERTEAKDSLQSLVFIKIHAPWNVLCKYAQLMNIKMPIKEDHFLVDIECLKCLPNPFALGDQYKPKERHYFTCVFNQEYMDRFLIENQDMFFDNAKRSRIVFEILSRCKYDMQSRKFGLNKLLSSKSYLTSFPLHDGPFLPPIVEEGNGITTEPQPSNDRQLLYEIWTRPKMFYKEQPIGLVRKYFGEKIAIYFAWLGFYTTMLIPAAFFGILCFIYGLLTLNSYVPTKELCDREGVSNITMCPLCDELCTFWKLKDSCLYSKLTYLFDNPATIVFSVFMSFWSTFFLELWKRKQNELAWDWDTKDFEEEEIVRPEYESQVKTLRRNPITNSLEPYLPFYSRALRLMGATIGVLTFLVMVIGIVFGIILYRLSIISVLHAQKDVILSQNAKITTNVSSAILNLIAILLLNKVYARIATYLTDLECPRTRTDYEDSYTLKMFLFQFVNYYSSLVYIAFFKGRFSGSPAGGEKLFGYKLEPCDPAGCMAELFIQFVVIMIGKQTLNNIQELFIPVLMNWWRRRVALNASLKRYHKTTASLPQYEEDYNLEDPGPMGLFEEYLEMAIQFGFTTMFVAAFPLAPFFSLLNNVIEIRLDAFKFVTQFRRTYSSRAQDIGIWFEIIQFISKLAVITNALIIAFTSDFIPKAVYRYYHSSNRSLTGYMNQSLSSYNLTYLGSSFKVNGNYTGSYSSAQQEGITACRYRDYREPEPPFNLTTDYWHILVARLAFVLIFEHFVFVTTEVIAYLIPDMPYILKVHLARQRLLLRGALYEYDMSSQTHVSPNHDKTAPGDKDVKAKTDRRLTQVSSTTSLPNRAAGSVHGNGRASSKKSRSERNLSMFYAREPDPVPKDRVQSGPLLDKGAASQNSLVEKRLGVYDNADRGVSVIVGAGLPGWRSMESFKGQLLNLKPPTTDTGDSTTILNITEPLTERGLDKELKNLASSLKSGPKSSEVGKGDEGDDVSSDSENEEIPGQRRSDSPVKMDATVPYITSKTRDSISMGMIKSNKNV